MGFRELDVVEFLETAWGTIEESPDTWLARVMRVLRPGLDLGLGVHGYFVDMSRPNGFETSGHQVLGVPDEAAAKAGFAEWEAAMPASFKRRIHTFAPYGSSGDLPADITTSEVRRSEEAHSYPEMIGVNGIDPTGRGCAIAAASLEPVPLPSRQLATLWARIAVHLGSATRLARRLAKAPTGPLGESQAVIEPGGRCVHATGEATEKLARAALRDGALRIDRARGRRARSSAKESLTLWQALVAGRWSLVDQFESDGRRYLVAVPNRPEVGAGECLTATEARIVGAMLMGHGNKVIAYELGMAPSTVGTHIARAASKLGVSGRVALMRRLAENPSLVTGGPDAGRA